MFFIKVLRPLALKENRYVLMVNAETLENEDRATRASAMTKIPAISLNVLFIFARHEGTL
jgi:hypothetical protein